LTLLGGRSGSRQAIQNSLVDLAAAIELVHTATLIHDDIVDGSLMRRKRPTFHERFGIERAVLMGDYLYAVAFSVLARLKEPYVTSYMAHICQQLSRGEILEVETRYRVMVDEAHYLQVVREKTASLIAACCHLGAYVAGATRDVTDRLTTFGWNFGMAFQIMDDCLDLIGDERVAGKTLRSDLEKGSLSLPIIYLARSLSARERRRLFAPLQRRQPTQAFARSVARAANRSGAIEEAKAKAEAFVREATQGLAQRNGVALVETYRQLARYAIERRS
jgi:octaprenyl-diphosphate synthase